MKINSEKTLRISISIFIMLFAAYQMLLFLEDLLNIGLLNTFLGSGVTSSFEKIWIYLGIPVTLLFFISGITTLRRKFLFSAICSFFNLVYIFLSWFPSLIHEDFRFPIWIILLEILNLLLVCILWFINKYDLESMNII